MPNKTKGEDNQIKIYMRETEEYRIQTIYNSEKKWELSTILKKYVHFLSLQGQLVSSKFVKNIKFTIDYKIIAM